MRQRHLPMRCGDFPGRQNIEALCGEGEVNKIKSGWCTKATDGAEVST